MNYSYRYIRTAATAAATRIGTSSTAAAATTSSRALQLRGQAPRGVATKATGTKAKGAKEAKGKSGVKRVASDDPKLAAIMRSEEICPATADIMDHYDGEVQVVPNTFRDYGGVSRFSGQVETVKCFENNPLVRQRLTGEDGTGKVLVVDGGGSLRVALMGDQIAAGAVNNGWKGVIIHGAIRDSAEIAKLPLGCKALGTMPRKSEKKIPGESGVPVNFAGLRFRPGQYVYADEDGIVVATEPLMVPRPGL